MAITDSGDIEKIMLAIARACLNHNICVVWEMYDAYEIFSEGELDTQVLVFDKGVLIPFYTQYTDGGMFIARTLVRYEGERFPDDAKLKQLFDICVPCAYSHDRGFSDFNHEERHETSGVELSTKAQKKKRDTSDMHFHTAFFNNEKIIQYKILAGINVWDSSHQKSVTAALSTILGGKTHVYSALVTSMRNHGLIEAAISTGRSLPRLTQKGVLLLDVLQQEITLDDLGISTQTVSQVLEGITTSLKVVHYGVYPEERECEIH